MYVKTAFEAETFANTLRMKGLMAMSAHSGMESTVKARLNEQFVMSNSLILVVTNDCEAVTESKNIRNIIHFDIPSKVTDYADSVKLAGLDGHRAHCIFLLSRADITRSLRQARGFVPSRESLERLLLSLFHAKRPGVNDIIKIPLSGLSTHYDITVSEYLFPSRLLLTLYRWPLCAWFSKSSTRLADYYVKNMDITSGKS